MTPAGRSARTKKKAGSATPAPAATHANAVDDASPPRLAIDCALAIVVTLAIALVARSALNPDGVAYLELADAAAHGDGARFVQGYWSPGLPALLAPVVQFARGDRTMLLALTHLLAGALAAAGLALAVPLVRRRVAPPLQRVAWWMCAWIIARWLTPALVTPDQLLVMLVITIVLLLDRPSLPSRLEAGALLGFAFLAKTSIWPSLLIAAGLACADAFARRDWRLVPWKAFAPAAVIVVAWLVVLGRHEGRITAGSVGARNAAWYLGDISRRTPDTDSTASRRKEVVRLADGRRLGFHAYRTGSETYLPWSDPDRWARETRDVPPPGFRMLQAGVSWRKNARLIVKYVVPLLLAIVLFGGAPRSGRAAEWRAWVTGRPLLILGMATIAVFAVVHVELRLIAPAALLCVIGGLGGNPVPVTGRALRAARGAVVLLIVADMAWNAREEVLDRAEVAEREAQIAEFVRDNVGDTGGNVVVTGPAVPLMGTLWRNHLRVGAQFDPAASATLMAVPDLVRREFLRQRFGDETLGATEVLSDPGDPDRQPLWTLHMWTATKKGSAR